MYIFLESIYLSILFVCECIEHENQQPTHFRIEHKMLEISVRAARTRATHMEFIFIWHWTVFTLQNGEMNIMLILRADIYTLLYVYKCNGLSNSHADSASKLCIPFYLFAAVHSVWQWFHSNMKLFATKTGIFGHIKKMPQFIAFLLISPFYRMKI